jgi:hypothetical protein
MCDRHQHGGHGCPGTAHGDRIPPPSASGITRRGLLGGFTGAALANAARGGSLRAAQPSGAGVSAPGQAGSKTALPGGKPLRVKPVLVYHLAQRAEKTSWRGYGGSITAEGIRQESDKISHELRGLAGGAEFPLEFLPLSPITSPGDAAGAAATDCDALLVFALAGSQAWLEALAASGKPNVLFVRHRSGPVYLWYETAHWWLLRKSSDEMKEPNLTVDDIVVDDFGEVLWRLRALYGLKNARGTRSIALGGLAPYSESAARNGPGRAKDVWGYDIQVVEMGDIEKRMKAARADAAVTGEAARQAEGFAAQPGVTLETEQRFIVNTFIALKVVRDILAETGGTNIGVANCMGQLIPVLDTTPCLLLSILNDEGITAFCHTDYSHTPPGVLLRWITGKPPFICNTHLPHDGVITLAHCAAPRRMNGREFEPTRIMTHFESDYGAATKVEYAAGQVITNIIPNVRCTKWFGFKGTVLESPGYDMCRSQMNVRIDGDWRRMLRRMEGFHNVVVYGDYLREVGYVLRQVRMPWENFSEPEGEAT